MKAFDRSFVLYCLLSVLFTSSTAGQNINTHKKANVKISFINCIGNKPIILDSNYINCWNESFTIHLLKYYISNVVLQTGDQKMIAEQNSYHLVNETDSGSKKITFYLQPGNYRSLFFMIGVDSVKNVSGAQSDALDPLNGMFWTWNSGYIMFKLEGSSPQSASINNKIEYHVGGFSGTHNTVKKVRINFPGNAVDVTDRNVSEIIVRVNIDKIWNAVNDLKIAQSPVCTTPGALAVSIAENYSKVFEIIKIVQQ